MHSERWLSFPTHRTVPARRASREEPAWPRRPSLPEREQRTSWPRHRPCRAMIFVQPSRVLPLLLACQSDKRQATRCTADSSRGLDALLGCETYVLPPDDQWPRTLLPAWPPYTAPPQPGTLVYVRKRGIGPSRVAASVAGSDDAIVVEPLFGPRAGAPLEVARRKAEVMRGRGQERAVLLCGETDSFRALSRSMVLPTDVVMEIGCSYGGATALLASRAKSVIAVDVSGDALSRAATECASHSNVRFERIDVVRDPARLLDDAVASGVSIVFVDINGNRAGDIVTTLLAALQERLHPALTVIKNRELYLAATAASDGAAPGSDDDARDPARMQGAADFWASVYPQAPACAASGGAQGAPGPQLALLPGAPKSPGEWPRFLFTFRATNGQFRLDELRAAALTLGVDPDRLRFQPASAVASTVAATAASAAPDTHTPRQPDLHTYGGDIGPDLFQWVSLPSAEVAAEVASRCSLVRGAFEVWATAAFPSAPPLPLEAAVAAANERWQLLADHAATAPRAATAMLSPIADESWRVDVVSVGVSRHRTLAGKVGLIETLGGLLGGLQGRVELKDPAHVITMIEDCRSIINSDMDVKDDKTMANAPSTLFLGRRLAEGAASHLARLSLSERSYLGRTTLPPDLAYLMAMQARCVPGSVVLDPFCGTCSILMSCAVLGATTVGIDVDAEVLHGTVDGQPGIELNFREADLEPPAKLIWGDMAEIEQLTAGSPYSRFDAIVTDPPYGLMEGLGPYYRLLSRRLTELLFLGCQRLRIGGRLVFLLPVPSSVHEDDAIPRRGLPTARCLEVETIARQRLANTDRLLVTMVKVSEPAEVGLNMELDTSGGSTGEWLGWWQTIDAIERANSKEARAVW